MTPTVLSEVTFWFRQKSIIRNFDDGGSRLDFLPGTSRYARLNPLSVSSSA